MDEQWAEDAAKVVHCLPSMHEAWWFPVPHKTEWWWPMPVILALGKWSQNIQKFKIIFSQVVVVHTFSPSIRVVGTARTL